MAKTETAVPTTAELTAQFIAKCEELKIIAQLLVADHKKETEGQLALGNGRINLAKTALRVGKRCSTLVEAYFPVSVLESKVDFYDEVATYKGHLNSVSSVLDLKGTDTGKDIVWYAFRIAEILNLKSKFDDDTRTELDELNKAIKDLVSAKPISKKAAQQIIAASRNIT